MVGGIELATAEAFAVFKLLMNMSVNEAGQAGWLEINLTGGPASGRQEKLVRADKLWVQAAI